MDIPSDIIKVIPVKVRSILLPKCQCQCQWFNHKERTSQQVIVFPTQIHQVLPTQLRLYQVILTQLRLMHVTQLLLRPHIQRQLVRPILPELILLIR